jgi:hypothetical protein
VIATTGEEVYPVPCATTLIAVTLPFAIVAIAVAPDPAPVIVTAGGVVYPDPPETILNEETYESVIDAVAVAAVVLVPIIEIVGAPV